MRPCFGKRSEDSNVNGRCEASMTMRSHLVREVTKARVEVHSTMLHFKVDQQKAKGWFFGPWNTGIPIPVGYANEGIDETHYHQKMFEIYLVAQGQSTIIVGSNEFVLRKGDVFVVEPNEVHSFVASSDDYMHFVIHAPFVQGDKVVFVERSSQ